jgi:CDP-glycerol glycerophosphotransferase (TagB/SpsB family)
VCSSTPLNIDIYKRQFKVKTEQVLVTGQPRNDQLNTERVQSKQNLIKKNVILFMPTWREYETKFSFFSKESGFNIEKINEFLKLHNALLVIKLHPAEKKLEVIKILKSSPCIKIYNKKTDLYDFLKDVNILITDYSSIYFDYLLLDRPIIFTPFDFQEYSTKRGFYYDYNEVTPGLKAISWDDLLNKIDLYLNNPNLDNNFRTKIRNKFNKYQDGNNCRRLSEKMKQV